MEKDLANGIKNLSNSLNKHEVKYMFVGGVAISFYGSARPSSNLPRDIDYDIDVWYLATNENFVKLTKSIAEISPELEDELKKIIFDPKKTFIKFNKEGFNFDFLPNLVAFYQKDFQKCYQKREIGEIDGVQINIISKEDLLLDKEKLGRDKDLADIENLKKNSYKGFLR
ncbi:nucleotidyltransferase [Ekhidna sp.]|uniref:nucleotidyltransferase n=1 Tax=Ekhidna sp. TaxID=2608089 RepID=UPI003C7E6999